MNENKTAFSSTNLRSSFDHPSLILRPDILKLLPAQDIIEGSSKDYKRMQAARHFANYQLIIIFDYEALIHQKTKPLSMTYQPFFFREGGFLKKINLEEILFIEAADNYVKFVAMEYHHTIRISLDATMAKLPEKLFIRTHRSFAVSMNYIDTIGKEYVLIQKYQFPVSKKYYTEFIKSINIFESSIADTTDQIKGPESSDSATSNSEN